MTGPVLRSPRPRPARAGALTLAIVFLFLGSGCSGRFRGPRTLAAAGGIAIAGGSVAWAAGEGFRDDGETSAPLVTAGFVAVAVGLAALAAAGGWMAASIACEHDPDCHDEEECREIPAPAGFVPYKQCMPRIP